MQSVVLSITILKYFSNILTLQVCAMAAAQWLLAALALIAAGNALAWTSFAPLGTPTEWTKSRPPSHSAYKPKVAQNLDSRFSDVPAQQPPAHASAFISRSTQGYKLALRRWLVPGTRAGDARERFVLAA